MLSKDGKVEYKLCKSHIIETGKISFVHVKNIVKKKSITEYSLRGKTISVSS